MTEKEKMLAGQLHTFDDEEIIQDARKAEMLCIEYNNTSSEEQLKREGLLQSILGTCGNNVAIVPLFRFNFGFNIHIGDNFYSNFDCIIIDECEVRIGKNCMIGPRTTICTATHPIDVETRISGLEYGKPIVIGDNVWIGGHVMINPGVTIGDNVIVAAGAVVTKDIPNNVMVGGVPAKTIKEL